MTYRDVSKETKRSEEYFNDLRNLLANTKRQVDYWELIKPRFSTLPEPFIPPRENLPIYKSKPVFQDVDIQKLPSYHLKPQPVEDRIFEEPFPTLDSERDT